MADLEKLDNAIRELEKQSNDLKDFNAVFTEIAKLKQDIADNLKWLEDNNKKLSDISSNVGNRLDEFQKRIEELYRDNKAFQKELDATITSRLEKHKSDIQVEVRNEGTQIQRAFETTLISNFNQMESRIKDAFDRQARQFSSLKVVTIILITISIVITIGIFVIK